MVVGWFLGLVNLCLGNISGEGFQGFEFGEEVMDVEVRVVYFVV